MLTFRAYINELYVKDERKDRNSSVFHATVPRSYNKYQDMHKTTVFKDEGKGSLRVDHDAKRIDVLPDTSNAWHPALTLKDRDAGRKTSTNVLVHNMPFQHDHELKKTLKAIRATHPNHDVGSYTVHGMDRHEGRRVNDVIRTRNVQDHILDHSRAEPLTMYHGTSSKKAAEILKNGLRPDKRGFDYSSIKAMGGRTYLSTSENEASSYATRQSADDKGKPTILKVRVHPKDFHRFEHDEDNLQRWSEHVFHPKLTAKLNKRYPEIEGKGIHRDMLYMTDKPAPRWTGHYNHELHTGGKTEDEMRSEIGKTFAREFNRLPHRMNNNTSLAFRGTIHPRNISVHSSWETKRFKDRDSNWQETDREIAAAKDHIRNTFRKGSL